MCERALEESDKIIYKDMPGLNTFTHCVYPLNNLLEGEKMKEYIGVEKTAVVEARVGHHVLAGLVLGMDVMGSPVRSRSELIRNSLEMFYEVLVGKGIIEPVASLDQAMEILAAYGFMGLDMNRSGRGKEKLRAALGIERQELGIDNPRVSSQDINLHLMARQVDQKIRAMQTMEALGEHERCLEEYAGSSIAEKIKLENVRKEMGQDICEDKSLLDKAAERDEEFRREKDAMKDFLAQVQKEE